MGRSVKVGSALPRRPIFPSRAHSAGQNPLRTQPLTRSCLQKRETVSHFSKPLALNESLHKSPPFGQICIPKTRVFRPFFASNSIISHFTATTSTEKITVRFFAHFKAAKIAMMERKGTRTTSSSEPANVPIGTSVPHRRLPTGRRVSQFQSAVVLAHPLISKGIAGILCVENFHPVGFVIWPHHFPFGKPA